ncbi:MgtC/SapB family protein [Patescibacteria group bacterium]
MITLTDIIIRLLVATLFSGILGFERKLAKKPAGLRTNILVGVGSTLLMIISIDMAGKYGNFNDAGRIAAQIVTGIGFLGAGAIIQSRGEVHGLTTAATIWAVAAIGMAVGMGNIIAAAIVTVLVIIVELVLRNE